MRDPRPDDLPDPAVPGSPPAPPAQQPALSWLADPPTRRHSAVLALLALPPVPTPTPAPAPSAEPLGPPPLPADRLPRRAPARPAPAVPGPRAPVLDRVWARDQDTLQRLLVGLRAL